MEAKIEDVLEALETNLSKVQMEVGDKMYIIDKDKDGVITTAEIATAIELLRDKPSEEEVIEVLKVNSPRLPLSLTFVHANVCMFRN